MGGIILRFFWQTIFPPHFFSGPDIPESCNSPSMVQSPDGNGIILVGCYNQYSEVSNALYEMTTIGKDLRWRLMPQKLAFPKSNNVAMLIPDELVTCI